MPLYQHRWHICEKHAQDLGFETAIKWINSVCMSSCLVWGELDYSLYHHRGHSCGQHAHDWGFETWIKWIYLVCMSLCLVWAELDCLLQCAKPFAGLNHTVMPRLQCHQEHGFARRWTAILIIIEGHLQVFQWFFCSKVVLKTNGSSFVALNYDENGSS